MLRAVTTTAVTKSITNVPPSSPQPLTCTPGMTKVDSNRAKAVKRNELRVKTIRGMCFVNRSMMGQKININKKINSVK